MKLNSEGLIARFYMSLPPRSGSLPKDFCTYFWGLIARLLAWIFIIGLVLVILLGIIMIIVKSFIFFSGHKIVGAVVLSIIALLTLLLYRYFKKGKIEFISESARIISTKVSSVKKNYCPRIEWE